VERRALGRQALVLAAAVVGRDDERDLVAGLSSNGGALRVRVGGHEREFDGVVRQCDGEPPAVARLAELVVVARLEHRRLRVEPVGLVPIVRQERRVRQRTHTILASTGGKSGRLAGQKWSLRADLPSDAPA